VIYYVGILDGADDVWGVRIPDCPGCHGGGATPEAAISDAISALREWAAMRADGVEVPAARTAAEILADPENRPDFAAGESAVLIPLMLDAGRTVRANVTFDAGLLERLMPTQNAEDSRAPPFWPALLARRSRHGIERLHTIGCLQNSFGNCALASTNWLMPRAMASTVAQDVGDKRRDSYAADSSSIGGATRIDPRTAALAPMSRPYS
jgi:predicted RNase H-like HicB family nuclease